MTRKEHFDPLWHEMLATWLPTDEWHKYDRMSDACGKKSKASLLRN